MPLRECAEFVIIWVSIEILSHPQRFAKTLAKIFGV